MKRVVGVVLAAGASTRMGTQKLLLPHGQGTILETTLSAVAASSVDETVVVTGANAPTVEHAIEGSAVTVLRNPDYRRGNMSSLLTGTAAVADAEAFVLVPGDMPTIESTAIDALIDVWRSQRPWAAVTSYADRIAHPFLLSSESVGALADEEGSKVLWRVLVDSEDPRVVCVHRAGPAPIDVNTRADYEELEA